MHMHMHKAAVCVVVSVDMHRITTTVVSTAPTV
jgi:hypothetical protein